MEKTKDAVSWKTNWRIDKFKDQKDTIAQAMQLGTPIEQAKTQFNHAFLETQKFASNIALNVGLQELIDIICGLGTPTKWDSTNSKIGVGDSNTAEAASQTGLQAQTNKTFKAMDLGYPIRSNQTVEWRATFGSADANYTWEEYTVANAAGEGAKNLNRKVASKGTKSLGETWVLSLQITFS
jgi:hypothetical protein